MLNLLLIDDDPNDRLLIKRELYREFTEINITEVTNESELEQRLIAKDFNFVITDYQLRWSDGLTVFIKIKSQSPACPVVMFTNTGNEEIAVAAMKAGLDDYIIKSPQHFFRLAIAVRSILNRVTATRKATRLENRLQSLLNQLNVGVFRANSEGVLVEYNNAFLRLLGLTPSQVEAKNLSELFLVSNKLSEDTSQVVEITLPQIDHDIKWISLTQTLNTTEAEIYIDGLVEDITQRKQAEAALQQLNQNLEIRVRQRTTELEEVNASLKEFAYFISHDLRAPLRSIQGFAQIIQNQYSDGLDAKAKDYLGRVIAASQQLSTLIKDLLDYSQLNRQQLQLQAVNLAEIIAQALSQLETELQAKNASVNVCEPFSLVVGNASLLLQVVYNLLANAIKFIQPGIQPQIRIWEQAEGEFICIYIEDNGIGIPKERQNQIFGVFERLHPEETYPGTGIGLAIVRKAAERMGGSAGVESEVGYGSKFYVRLRKYNFS